MYEEKLSQHPTHKL